MNSKILVEIDGLQQDSIEVALNIIPRQSEILKVMYGADAEIEGEVKSTEHYINQHANEHKIRLTIRPIG